MKKDVTVVLGFPCFAKEIMVCQISHFSLML